MRIDSFLSRLSVLLVAGAFLSVCPVVVLAQQAGADAPTAAHPASSAAAPAVRAGFRAAVSAAQIGTISGTVTDAQDEVVPGAEVTVEGPDPGDSRKTVANDLGAFQFDGLKPNVAYRLTIQAKGFVDWKSSPIVLSPGQVRICFWNSA